MTTAPSSEEAVPSSTPAPSGRDDEAAEIVIATRTAIETRRLGARLGRQLRRGDVLLLHGDLGAGKTTLAQGIAAGFGIAGPVQSPTFTLVNEYDGRDAAGAPLRLYHLDLYRITSDDLDSFGFDDYLAPVDGITLIEWPERATERVPEHALIIHLTATTPDGRRFAISALGDNTWPPRRLELIRSALRETTEPKPPSCS